MHAIRDQYKVSEILKLLEKITQNQLKFPELLSSVYSIKLLI
jgi:hypothetical protein